MKLYPIIIAIYQELYAQATMHKSYKFIPKKQERLWICAFIKWLRLHYVPHQLNQDLLIAYFEFGFSRYAGVKTPRGKNNIMLNWLIGKKAMEAWRTRNVKKRYLVRWHCSKDFKLKLKAAFANQVKVNNSPFAEGLNAGEEQAKQRFHNMPEGYLYCADFTTLYHPKSQWCRSCKSKLACLERLKLNFEKLYLKRTYNGLQNIIKASA